MCASASYGLWRSDYFRATHYVGFAAGYFGSVERSAKGESSYVLSNLLPHARWARRFRLSFLAPNRRLVSRVHRVNAFLRMAQYKLIHDAPAERCKRSLHMLERAAP